MLLKKIATLIVLIIVWAIMVATASAQEATPKQPTPERFIAICKQDAHRTITSSGWVNGQFYSGSVSYVDRDAIRSQAACEHGMRVVWVQCSSLSLEEAAGLMECRLFADITEDERFQFANQADLDMVRNERLMVSRCRATRQGSAVGACITQGMMRLQN